MRLFQSQQILQKTSCFLLRPFKNFFFFHIENISKNDCQIQSNFKHIYSKMKNQIPFLDVLLTILSTKTHVSIGTFHFRPSWIPSWINLFFLLILYADLLLWQNANIIKEDFFRTTKKSTRPFLIVGWRAGH